MPPSACPPPDCRCDAIPAVATRSIWASWERENPRYAPTWSRIRRSCGLTLPSAQAALNWISMKARSRLRRWPVTWRSWARASSSAKCRDLPSLKSRTASCRSPASSPSPAITSRASCASASLTRPSALGDVAHDPEGRHEEGDPPFLGRIHPPRAHAVRRRRHTPAAVGRHSPAAAGRHPHLALAPSAPEVRADGGAQHCPQRTPEGPPQRPSDQRSPEPHVARRAGILEAGSRFRLRRNPRCRVENPRVANSPGNAPVEHPAAFGERRAPACQNF